MAIEMHRLNEIQQIQDPMQCGWNLPYLKRVARTHNTKEPALDHP